MDQYSLSCRDSPRHRERWLIRRPSQQPPDAETDCCLSCVVSTLEDGKQLAMRKRHFLSAVLDVLHEAPHAVVAVLQTDDQAAVHTVGVFMDLAIGNSESLVSSAGECLLLLLIHLKKEALVMAVVQNLSVGVFENCNYQQSLFSFKLLGKVLQLFPVVVRSSSITNGQFLNYLAVGLAYPSDDVKSAILFILFQIYSGDPAFAENSTGPSYALALNGAFSILQTETNKELLKNALALLKTFISKNPQKVTLLFENPTSNSSFPAAIKCVLLTEDPVLQVCIIQCLCHTLEEKSTTEKYICMLMEANIPEFLFEMLSTSNELLFESILCCFICLSRHSIFFEKCPIYGIESIMSAISRLVKIKSWRLLTMSLNLLTSMFTSYQNSSAIVPQNMIFQQSTHMMEELFKINNPPVLLAASTFFNMMLRKEHLPWPLPVARIYGLVKQCVALMVKLLRPCSQPPFRGGQPRARDADSGQQLPLETRIFVRGLAVIETCSRLMKEHSLNPVSMEIAFSCPAIQNGAAAESSPEPRESDEFMHFLMLVLDEMFIPCYLAFGASESKRTACFYLIRVLGAFLDYNPESPVLTQLIRKLMKTGFLKQIWDIKSALHSTFEHEQEEITAVTNLCLKRLIFCLLRNQNISDAYLTVIETGIAQLNKSLQESACILSQRCDLKDPGQATRNTFAAQATFLCLCYISYLQEKLIVDVSTILPHLIYYCSCNLDTGYTFLITWKHLIFVLAICTHELRGATNEFQTGLSEVNLVIKDHLSKVSPQHEVYTHHKVLLWWCFHDECESNFASFALEIWLKSCLHSSQLAFNEAVLVLLQLLCANGMARITFAKLFDIDNLPAAQQIVHFLKLAWEHQMSKFETSLQKENLEDLIKFVVERMHVRLVSQLMMRNDRVEEMNDKFLSVGLNFLLWYHQNVNSIHSSDLEIKLAFHVSKFCSTTQNEEESVLVPCLNYLQMVTSGETVEKAWHAVSSNATLSPFLQKCITQRTAKLKTAALQLLSTVFAYQVENGLKCEAVIRVPVPQVLNWLNSEADIRGPAFRLLRTLTSAGFRDAMFCVASTHGLLDPGPGWPLSAADIRLLLLFLQNALLVIHPMFDSDVVCTFINLLNVISKIDTVLECHLMNQPWNRVMLESRLGDMRENTLRLFEKWLDFGKVNPSLAGVMSRFAGCVLEMERGEPGKHRTIVNKLINGIYRKCIPKSVRQQLKEVNPPDSLPPRQKDLLTQVEQMVTSYLHPKGQPLKDS